MSVSRPSNVAGSPSASRSQPTTTFSSSVPIGDVRHSIGFWPSAAVRNISPSRSRARRRRREVGQEPRVLPVRGVRLDEAVVVGEDRVDRFGLVGRVRPGSRGPTDPGSIGRQHGVLLDAGEVVGHQVDDVVGRRTERLRVHVVEAVDLLGIEPGLPHVRHPASLPGPSAGSRPDGQPEPLSLRRRARRARRTRARPPGQARRTGARRSPGSPRRGCSTTRPAGRPPFPRTGRGGPAWSGSRPW